MFDRVLLSLAEGCGDSCGSCGDACGTKLPIRICADALRDAGARVETVTAESDADIDAVIKRFDADARTDGLDWPDADSKFRLIVATSTDGQLRAGVRRVGRPDAPPP